MRVGCIGYCTAQGLGRLMQSFFNAGVVTDPILVRHRHHENHPEWYPEGTPWLADVRRPTPQLVEWVSKLDALVAFETPFVWGAFDVCRDQGVRSVLVPMHEWTPRVPPALPSFIACPSKLDKSYFPGIVDGLGWLCVPSAFVPIPVDDRVRWRQRERAIRFLHNAGHVGHRGHKGTLELLRAVPLVKSPDFRLTVRFQDQRELSAELNEVIRWVCVDPRLTVEYGDVPYERLFDGFDVYVAPEKFNGLSLPLQEAFASGLAVMTTDRFPHNDWLPREPLVPAREYRKACISENYLSFDEALVDPQDVAAKIDEWVGRDISELSLRGREWADAHSWAALKSRWLEVLSA